MTPQSASVRYLVIVSRSEPALLRYLAANFARDPKTLVLPDRRRGERRQHDRPHAPERRRTDRRTRALSGDLDSRRVIIVRQPGAVTSTATVTTPTRGGAMTTSESGIGEERQRVDRWIEESQYLIGRLIPAMLDDRERLRAKSDATEAEIDRLRQEISELRREVADLQAERQFLRGEQTAITDAFARAMEHFAQAQQPLNEIIQRLQVPVAPVGS